MTQLRFTERGTKSSLRAANDVLVLQCVAALGRGCSRTDVVRATDLPAATVSAIVADLIERRLVREAGFEAQPRGKPRVLLELDGSRHRFIGVQVAEGMISAGRFTLTGQVEQSLSVPHALDEDPVPAIADVVGCLTADAAPGSVTGVGVAVPGIVGDDGVIREAVNYGWHLLPLGAELSRRCDGLPVHIINDVNAVVLSEVALSTGSGGTVAVVWVGTGIGAGIVLDGRLYSGSRFRSGEIGHIDTGVSMRCRCGLIGCLETVAAQPSIRGTATADVVARYLSGVDDGETRALAERVARAARHLARLLSTLAGTLDVTEFVLGGPILTDPLGPGLLRAVGEALALRVMSGFEQLTLRASALGAHSMLFGAAAHAVRRELGVVIAMPAGAGDTGPGDSTGDSTGNSTVNGRGGTPRAPRTTQ